MRSTLYQPTRRAPRFTAPYRPDAGPICLKCQSYDCEHVRTDLKPIRLTPRDISILKLIAETKKNEEIGELLGISGDTVKTYNSRIFAKIGVKNRTDAARWVWERPELFR
jgi:DNA-binding NarL/FixJ family response regulator